MLMEYKTNVMRRRGSTQAGNVKMQSVDERTREDTTVSHVLGKKMSKES